MLLVAFALACSSIPGVSAHAASSPVTVTVTVPSATQISTAGCPTMTAGITGFGAILPGGSAADLTFDGLIDGGQFFCGDPDTVCAQIERFYCDVGGFGTLLLVMGKDWGTRAQRTGSMERFMAEVAPRLAGLDPDKNPPRAH